ncbi:Intracellular exo-alpha-L-arabinofuranosidase 2 [compost metagenome]
MTGASLKVAGTTLAGSSIDAHNTFAQPEAVKPQTFSAFALNEGKLTVTLPPMSVTALELASN